MWDFGGNLPGPTFTAHPKIDGETGNMYAYGYEAKGDASTDICFYGFDRKGNKIEECWIKAPYTGFPHWSSEPDRRDDP
jgi:carotenoid cleavage dioxygenase